MLRRWGILLGMMTLVGGVAVATWAPPKPTLTLETELPDQDEYEVRIYDERHGRRLVAAIELISPANKDRPESRRAFVGKVAADLLGEPNAHLLDNLLRSSHVRRDFRHRLQNQAEIADGDALGEQELQSRQEPGLRDL